MPPLGGIVSSTLNLDENVTLYSPLFDPYDHWREIDNRIKSHEYDVFTYPGAIGNDILHMSIYAHYIWSSVDTIRSDPTAGQELADLQAFVEAFLTSSRSMCDGIAAYLSQTCFVKRGQAPPRLGKLIRWIGNNPDRASIPELQDLLANIDWFEQLRSIRDAITHFGGYPWISTDGHNFQMVIQAPFNGVAIADVDLLQFLRDATNCLLDFMDESGKLINLALELPDDRLQSRTLLGHRLPSLDRLRNSAS